MGDTGTTPAAVGPRRHGLVVAGIGLGVLGLIGFGLYRVVDFLRPPPIEAPPEEMRSTPGLQQFLPSAPRRLMARLAPISDTEEPPAVPSDHPFAKTRITGRVYDILSGDPIAGASVRVRPSFGVPRLGPRDGDGSAVFLSRADGSYAMKGVPPGTFDLEVGATGYAPARSSFKKFSALEDDDGFDVGLVRSSAIEGRVLDEAGSPIAEAWVRLGGTPDFVARDRPRLDVVTGPDGAFVLDPADARDVQIVVRHAAFSPEQVLIPASEEPSRSVEVRLKRSRMLQGVVRDVSGPVAGAQVTVFVQRVTGAIIATRPEESPSTRSGPDGRFALASPIDGPSALWVTATGYATVAVTVPEETTAPVEVMLDRGVGFRGRVLAADGSGAQGAHVMVMAGRPGATPPRDAWTDADGRFAMEGLPGQGPYTIRIQHFAHPPLFAVEEALGGDQVYRLTAESKILGTLLDARSGAPVTRYSYTVLGPSRRRASAVSISGSFEVDQLESGTYSLAVDAEGYEPFVVEEVLVGVGEVKTLAAFRLVPAATVTGSVRGGEGLGVVRAWAADGEIEAEALVDADGAFKLEGLRSGVYRLTAELRGPSGFFGGDIGGVEARSGEATGPIELQVRPGHEADEPDPDLGP